MSLKQAVKQIRKALCYVHSDSPGSGFVVGESLVLTCGHVARGRVSVVPAGGEEASAEIVFESKELDLALLRTGAVGGRVPLALHRSGCSPGTAVGLAGFPFSNLFDPPMAQIMSAVIGNRYRFDDDIDRYVLDAMIAPGISGGPVFLESGSVCGIVSARFDPAGASGNGLKKEVSRTCISFAITSRDARKWVSRMLKLIEPAGAEGGGRGVPTRS